jgi:P4 family phage/plasmid primase-like protien
VEALPDLPSLGHSTKPSAGNLMNPRSNTVHSSQRDILADILTQQKSLDQKMKQARTANHVADILFPVVTKEYTAFVERASNVNQLPVIELVDVNEDYWVTTLGWKGGSPSPIVYSKTENLFRRFSESKGIYEPITESLVVSEILRNLDLTASYFPERVKPESYFALKTKARIKAMVERAKDLLAEEDTFFHDQSPKYLPLQNGIYDLDSKTFKPFDRAHPIRETLPVKYDPQARCDLFLHSFLEQILDPPDLDLLQRYGSQILLGLNHTQTILILTGDAGWGKSSCMKILGNIIGWKNVGIIREQLFKNEFELAHYQNKRLLFHPDMPTDFLDRPEASIFKQLCGGDPMWADVKGGDERITIEGNFPVILACNGKPKIHLDSDTDAWTRRIVVLSFRKPEHETHLGKMAELIIKNESSGVLNWLLEGWARLWRNGMQLVQTPEQRNRAAKLLLSSESPKAFVAQCLKKNSNSIMGSADLYAHYQEWCREQSIPPFASQAFTQMVRDEIEVSFGLKYRHDLADGYSNCMRGWKGLGLIEPGNSTNSAGESG